MARHEDLGPMRIDVTSEALVPMNIVATAVFRPRKQGVISGLALLPHVAAAYSDGLHVQLHANDGDEVAPLQDVATVIGSLRDILAFERVALNYITHLSGIATMTAAYVKEVQGTNAGVYDTRKTIPGLRHLAKYAVKCGGGRNHRIGLYDAMLVKDNHLSFLPQDKLTEALREAIEKARATSVHMSFVEVEVDTLEQLALVMPAGPDLVLLDNMPPEIEKQAVAMRDEKFADIELEASGGITIENIREHALAGVDRIAIGALTHSAVALDVGLDIDSQTA